MRLSRFTIRNFKGIKETTLVIPRTDPDSSRTGSADFLSILGENNTCKSSILEALRLALPGTGLTKPTIDHFPGCQIENGPIQVELEFDDIDEHDMEQMGIRPYVYNGKYRIRREWVEALGNAKLYAFTQEAVLALPEDVTGRKQIVETGPEWEQLINGYEEANKPYPAKGSATARTALLRYARETNSPLVAVGNPNWFPDPAGISSNVDTVLPRVIHIPAIRETSEEANISRQKSTARQIVDAMFTRHLADNEAVAQFTKAGEEVKKLFDGEEGHEIIRGMEQRITTKISRLIDLKAALDFTPPDIQADLASKVTLDLVDGAIRTRPEHQGHGAQRSLVLSLLELFAEDSISETKEGFQRSILFLFEEPEIYLHPQMCRKMRDALMVIARSGTAQVICTTHSPVFLDLADRHDGIAIFRREPEGVKTIQHTEDLYQGASAQAQRQRLRMVLDFDPSVNEVFFSREVCLAEGDCELAALEAIARRLSELGEISWEKYLLARRGLTLVNCRGKWTITAFQRVLRWFEIGYRVIHDVDAEGEDDGANKAIRELCHSAEDDILHHKPNFEQEHFNEVWTRDKPWKAVQKIRQMDPVPDGLIKFFAFAIGRNLEELKADELEAV